MDTKKFVNSVTFILHYLRITPESPADVPSCEYSIQRCLDCCTAITQLTQPLLAFDDTNSTNSLRASRLTPFTSLPPYAIFALSVVRPFLSS